MKLRETPILIAEKAALDAHYLQLILTQMGWTADIAENGGDALLRLQGKPYALVLVNGQLPDMDGPEAVRRICKEAKDQRPTIVGLTNTTLAVERRSFLNAGSDQCLQKPIYKQELQELLARISSKRAQQPVA